MIGSVVVVEPIFPPRILNSDWPGYAHKFLILKGYGPTSVWDARLRGFLFPKVSTRPYEVRGFVSTGSVI